MITLAFLKYLENKGVGVVDVTGKETNPSLFWQKMTLDKKGLYISSLGGEIRRGQRNIQNFELYSRGYNDVDACQLLTKVCNLVQADYGNCALPAVPPVFENSFNNVTVEVTSPPTNMGLDNNGRVIYSITGRIIY